MEKVRALGEYLSKTAEALRSEEVPVDDSLRVDMDAFDKHYDPTYVARDKVIVEDYLQKFHPGLSEQERNLRELQSDGAQIEMLKSAILHKKLKERFIVCRTSRYDDIKNGVDNIVLDRQTGKPVCALDDVGDISGSPLEMKKQAVLKKNFTAGKEGAVLRYGMSLNGPKVLLGECRRIPTFYLALPREAIRRGIDQFSPDDNLGSNEEKLCDYFLATLAQQTRGLQINPAFDSAPEEFRQVTLNFDRTIKEFINKRG